MKISITSLTLMARYAMLYTSLLQIRLFLFFSGLGIFDYVSRIWFFIKSIPDVLKPGDYSDVRIV